MIFGATGPSIALFSTAQGPISRVPVAKAFKNLKENAEIFWLIRLIPFDPRSTPQLAVSALARLGPVEQKYTFVAPYEELRGYPVDRAVLMTGGHFRHGDHVSAVIFQVGENTIYPANARGLLQVVWGLEQQLRTENRPHFLLRNTSRLESDDYNNLSNISIYSWRWDNYKDRYPRYCKAAHEFRCNNRYTARELIGGLYKDWHPFGLAQEEQNDPCSMTAEAYCSKTDWEEQKPELLRHFGSRVFLIQNYSLSELEIAI
jgi:hypothetical protein